MGYNTTNIRQAAKLLEDAIRLIISLKVTKNSNSLKVVVLDSLEVHLKELNELIKEELEKNLLDEAKGWKLMNILFKKLTNYLYKILTNITLFCKHFLLRQKLTYTSLP